MAGTIRRKQAKTGGGSKVLSFLRFVVIFLILDFASYMMSDGKKPSRPPMENNPPTNAAYEGGKAIGHFTGVLVFAVICNAGVGWVYRKIRNE